MAGAIRAEQLKTRSNMTFSRLVQRVQKSRRQKSSESIQFLGIHHENFSAALTWKKHNQPSMNSCVLGAMIPIGLARQPPYAQNR